MGNGSYRSTGHGGAPVARTLALAALCALLLGGCESIEQTFDQTLEEVRAWEPFGGEDSSESATAGAGDDASVTAAPGDEVALDAALTSEVQTKLAELGYQPGPVDGVMGPKTRGAIRRYQVVEGLPVDGRVTETFLARLSGAPKNGEPSAPEEEAAAPATGGLAAGPPPAYEVGSRYVYDDGEVRTVLEVDGDRVYWKSSTSAQAVAYRNFLIPPLSWGSPEVNGERSLDSAPGELWLHDGGREVTFTTTAVVEEAAQPDSQSELTETWRCRVEGESELSVRAGDFRTRQIVCDGQLEPEGIRLQRIWHYAPEIAHYLVFEEIEESRGRSRRSELLAIVPSTGEWPPVAQAGLGWAIEHALETAAPGEATTWTSSAVETKVTITPGPPAASAKDEACRSFVQTWIQPEGTRIYPGYSCRNASGKWLIPGLGSGVTVAKSAN